MNEPETIQSALNAVVDYLSYRGKPVPPETLEKVAELLKEFQKPLSLGDIDRTNPDPIK